MSEITPAPAPGSEGGAPAAPAPAPAPAPPSAPAPTDPNQPAAPVAPEAPAEQKTPEQLAEEADAKEWEDAESQIFPGLKPRAKKPQEGTDEQTKSGEKSKEVEASEDPNAPKKPDAEPGVSDDTEKQGDKAGESGDKPTDDGENQNSAANYRQTARQIAEQKQAVAEDIRAKLFANVPDTLQDADGDPITGPEDVMKLIDPRTGEPFTEEAAYTWFLQANQQFKESRAQVEDRISKLADLHLDIKDQADAMNAKYGEWLKAHPEKRDEIWADFNATFQRDPETGLIIGMPMSLDKFYERAVGPLVAQEQKQVADANAQAQAQAAAEAKAKADAEAQKRKDRADRSDIYQPPANPNEDPEDKEWADAERAVFGDQLNRK